jgi:hypothetical protein
MRWRVWMMVASAVCVVVATPATLAKKADRDGVGGVVGALVDDLEDDRPVRGSTADVTWTPPVPQP